MQVLAAQRAVQANAASSFEDLEDMQLQVEFAMAKAWKQVFKVQADMEVAASISDFAFGLQGPGGHGGGCKYQRLCFRKVLVMEFLNFWRCCRSASSMQTRWWLQASLALLRALVIKAILFGLGGTSDIGGKATQHSAGNNAGVGYLRWASYAVPSRMDALFVPHFAADEQAMQSMRECRKCPRSADGQRAAQTHQCLGVQTLIYKERCRQPVPADSVCGLAST
eukprot:1139828-Pelagomonas_calceolata.AAC.3